MEGRMSPLENLEKCPSGALDAIGRLDGWTRQSSWKWCFRWCLFRLENFSVGPDLRFWIRIVLCSCHRLRIARIVSYHQSMYCISLDAIYLFLVRSISWFRVLPSFCCTKNVNKTTNLKPYTLELCMAMQHDSIWDRNNNETEPDSGWSSIRGHLRKMSRHSGKRDSTKDKSISVDLERGQSAYVKAEAQHLGDGHARRGQDDLLRGVVKLTMYETKYMCNHVHNCDVI